MGISLSWLIEDEGLVMVNVIDKIPPVYKTVAVGKTCAMPAGKNVGEIGGMPQNEDECQNTCAQLMIG
jgi:hypothetical protein